MKYGLVLQFESAINYDDLVGLEDKISELLGRSAEVDGHQIGREQVNIFVYTNRPRKIFRRIKKIIGDDLLGIIKVGYRLLDEKEYTVLWPENCTFFEIT